MKNYFWALFIFISVNLNAMQMQELDNLTCYQNTWLLQLPEGVQNDIARYLSTKSNETQQHHKERMLQEKPSKINVGKKDLRIGKGKALFWGSQVLISTLRYEYPQPSYPDDDSISFFQLSNNKRNIIAVNRDRQIIIFPISDPKAKKIYSLTIPYELTYYQNDHCFEQKIQEWQVYGSTIKLLRNKDEKSDELDIRLAEVSDDLKKIVFATQKKIFLIDTTNERPGGYMNYTCLDFIDQNSGETYEDIKFNYQMTHIGVKDSEYFLRGLIEGNPIKFIAISDDKEPDLSMAHFMQEYKVCKNWREQCSDAQKNPKKFMQELMNHREQNARNVKNKSKCLLQ